MNNTLSQIIFIIMNSRHQRNTWWGSENHLAVFNTKAVSMHIQLILITCMINTVLTHNPLRNQIKNPIVTTRVHDDGEIKGNLQNLFESIAKSDPKRSKIYREILHEVVGKKQKAFDALKDELYLAQGQRSYNIRPFNPKGKLAIKREINGNNDTADSTQKQLHSCPTGQEFSKNHHSQPSIATKYDWNVSDILHGAFSIVMLNTPIVHPDFATSVWRKAKFKMLVDGAGNVLYDLLFNKSSQSCPQDLPNVLCGDFDSVCANVLDFFQKLNVKIVHTPDQEEPDFFKGLRVLAENTNDPNVLVYCDAVGRLDHVMQNINTLFQCSLHETLSRHNIFLLNHESLTWVLNSGSHVIRVPQHLWTDKSICGLFPIGQPSYHVTTKGLKYNLDDRETQFGKMVSTSNGYDVSSGLMEVHISTDNRLVWTMTMDEK